MLPATGVAMLVMRNDRMSARRSATIAAVSLLATVPFVLRFTVSTVSLS